MLGGKPLASLSSGLLARKGEARPAMRRAEPAPVAALDDLGWNDMGLDRGGEPAPLPPVLEERRALEQEVAAVVAGAAATKGRKAAFTLRLDAERHLRLRLAAATRGRSAQQIVTEALDRLLAAMPEVETLRAQLPADQTEPTARGY